MTTPPARRHYEVRPEDDRWSLRVELLPHPRDGIWRVDLFNLREEQAHQACAFAMAHEGVPMEDLYELTEQHIGREPHCRYGQFEGGFAV